MTSTTTIADVANKIAAVVNRGAITGSITTSGGSYTIAAGYHNGSGKVTGPTLASLVGSNVNLANGDCLLSGITAYGKNGTKYTGTLANRDLVDANAGGINASYPTVATHQGSLLQMGTTTKDNVSRISIQVPNGVYRYGSYVNMPSSSFGTATAGNVLSGATFTSTAGIKVSGTMRNHTGTPNKIQNRRIANNRFEVAVDAGYHGCYWAGNSYEYMEFSEVASTIGLTAAKIVSGNTILGIAGTDGGYAAGVAAGKSQATLDTKISSVTYIDGKNTDGNGKSYSKTITAPSDGIYIVVAQGSVKSSSNSTNLGISFTIQGTILAQEINNKAYHIYIVKMTTGQTIVTSGTQWNYSAGGVGVSYKVYKIA